VRKDTKIIHSLQFKKVAFFQKSTQKTLKHGNNYER